MSTAASSKTLEQIYQKKSQLEHILLRPDSYIGSIQKSTCQQWILDESAAEPKIVSKNISYVPGLYKIFDEILVNAADNKQRDKSMTALKVTINAASNTVTVWNNGRGIPVAIHAEHKVYIPEMIFGHLLTSSNYDDEEKKVVGGRNGYGAKLANIFSTEFSVETADSSRKILYKQTWSGNMGHKTDPAVTAFSGGSDYTCVTFKPDLARFKMNQLEEDTVALLSKRVFDMAGVLGKGVQVYLNGNKINIHSFQEYVALYPHEHSAAAGGASSGAAASTGAAAEGSSHGTVMTRINDRWEVGVGVSDGYFTQVSFVNAICTTKGGQHVTYIADQVASAVVEAVAKKEKGKGVSVKPMHVKNYLSVYVNCLVENPAFDSQTKDTLTTRIKDFGSVAELTESFLKKVLATGVVDRVLSFARFKATSELQRAGGGKKNGRLLDMPKLDDANLAGTAKGPECTLILTEGDSAKSLAIAGLSVVGRDRYGVFPLKGKLLNVREASHKSIMANLEIQNIVKIMGLQYGKSYDPEAARGLRYGHLMIMSDQDHDGSHIKGLVLNFLHHFWPSLLGIPSFLRQFITPIVKASKGKHEHSFFTLPEYQAWKEAQMESAGGAAPAIALRGWSIKYYKGLGTSTAVEARAYFSALGRHALDFTMDVPQDTGERADDLIDMAFSKKRADDRKSWLGRFTAGTHIDYATNVMLVSDFINRELILFSMADNVRSIPSIMDGMKPAQRKVLFACFKRNLKNDIKVAQLAGYVSEHASYHHGEQSLTATITGMAQDYTGANNIPLLVPSGQFGTRLQGGKDAASARYIFTRLSALARAVFHPDDDALLTYLDDDGQSIEPEYYLPVLPMALVNGVEGIGTGWSTSVPAYNPRDLIACVRARIQGDTPPTLIPWYRGFTGTVLPKDATNTVFTVTGRAQVAPNGEAHVLTVSELPVGRWTQDYKSFLVTMMMSPADREKEREKEKGKAAPGGPKPNAAAKAAAAAAVKGGKKADGAVAKKGPAKAKAQAKGGKAGGDDEDDEEEGGAPRAARTAKAKGAAKSKSAARDDEDGEDGAGDEDGDFGLGAESDTDDESFNSAPSDDDDEDGFGGGGKKKKAKAKKAPGAGAGAEGGGGRQKSKATEDREAYAALVPSDQPLVKDFTESHTDTTVHFTIRTTPAAAKLMASAEDEEGPCLSALVRKVFKLESTINTSNMHLFTAEGGIRKYADPVSILNEYYSVRLEAYSKRKELLLAKLGEESDRLGNRMRFIKAVINGELKISNRKRAELLAELHDGGYKGYEPKDAEEADAADADVDAGSSVGVLGTSVPQAVLARRYAYLLNMPLLSLTWEKVQALRSELSDKETTLVALKATPPTELWLNDLKALEAALTDYETAVAGDAANALKAAAAGRKAGAAKRGAPGAGAKGSKGGKGAGKGKGKGKGSWADSDDDDGEDNDDEDEEEEEEPEYKPLPRVRGEAAPKPKPAAPAAAVALKAALPKAVAASKPAAPAAVSKPLVAAVSKPSFVIELEDSDEDMSLGLTLAQRLAKGTGAAGGSAGAGAVPAAAPAPAPAAAKRPAAKPTAGTGGAGAGAGGSGAAQAQAQAQAKKRKVTVIESDEEDEEDSPPPKKKAMQAKPAAAKSKRSASGAASGSGSAGGGAGRPGRGASKGKKSYVEDSEEEEEEDEWDVKDDEDDEDY